MVAASGTLSNRWTYDLLPITQDIDLPSSLRYRQSEKPKLSQDGQCGDRTDDGNGWRCPSTIEEQAILEGKSESSELEKLELKCCSALGYCGGTPAHCGSGCQSKYGSCSPGAENPGPGHDLTCGPTYNNRTCSLPEHCCSEHGYCGTGKDYCQSPQCLLGFGRCDASIIPWGRNTSWVDRQFSRVRIRVNGKDVDYGVDIFKCNNPGHVALTYDDGPYNFTTELLDILREFGVKATFFITGVNKGKGPIDDPKYGWTKVIRKMYAEGHQVASHTWSHADLDELNEWDRQSEMIKLEMALRNILGVIPTYMRPPYSSCTSETGCLSTMKTLGYYVINFSLNTEDYFHTTPSQIQLSKNIFSQALSKEKSSPAKDSHLVIAHDISQQSAVNLTKHMLEVMKEGGWKGVTVGECLELGGVGSGEAGWYRVAENESEKRERELRGKSEGQSDGKGRVLNDHRGEERNAVERWEGRGLGWRVGLVAVVVGWVVVGI